MNKKILIVTGRARTILNFREELILSLVKNGYDVHLGVPKDTLNAEIKEITKRLDCTVHFLDINRVSISPVSDLKLIFQIRKIIKSNKIDKIFSYNVKSVVFSGIACMGSNVDHSAMITGLGYALISKTGFKRRLFYYLTAGLYKFSFLGTQKVIFQNPDDLEMFKKNGLIRKKNTVYQVNGSGVNLNKFPFSEVPDGNIVFLMVARLLGDKGVREYLNAAKAVKKNYPEVTFLLAGDFDNNPNAVSPDEVKPYIDQGVITHLGRISNVAEQLRDCSVFVLPSYREGTPRAVLEALAVGRPVITTLAPGCRETTVDEYNGYLVPVANTDKLIFAMIKLVEDKSLIQEFGMNSYKLAKDKYDVGKVNIEMIRIFAE